MRELSQPALLCTGETGAPPDLGRKAAHGIETKMLSQVKARVANWDSLETSPFQLMYDFDEPKKKQSRGTEAVMNALVLSFDNRFRQLKEPSRQCQTRCLDSVEDPGNGR